ncbi:hypothetical protein [Wenyingzhuangia aestuarii]|uniref:hypothetical protein n=1 Tax=Wenyingzhuangia aestuarii TaxID=1647582 RepID=UPI0014397F0E|nr:hypothetical protein [Wenyingzhuangia aestuarii]NJB82212.1 hypothetical protein [Wenyingzhuangia aestuarii]
MLHKINILILSLAFLTACKSDNIETPQEVSATKAVLEEKSGHGYPRVSDDTNSTETYDITATAQITIENYNAAYTYKLKFTGQQYGKVYEANQVEEVNNGSEEQQSKRIAFTAVSEPTTSNGTLVKFDVEDLKMDVDFYDVTLIEVESKNEIAVGNYRDSTQPYRILDINSLKLATSIAIQIPNNIGYVTSITENQTYHLNFVGRNQKRLYVKSTETPYLVFLNKSDKSLVKKTEVFYANTINDNSTNTYYYNYDVMDTAKSTGIAVGDYWVRLEMITSTNETVSQSPLVPLSITASSNVALLE